MPASGHLSPDAIEGYARGLLPPAELLAADDHVQACAACRGRLLAREPVAAWEAWEGLLQAEDATSHGTGGGQRLERWRLPALAAAALIAAALGGYVLLERSRMAPAAPHQGEAPPRTAATPVVSARPPGAGERAATSSSAGGPELAALPAPWREALQQAFATRRLDLPQRYAALVGGAGVLRGRATTALLAPLTPVATAVRGDRPTFRWRPLPGASTHRVMVFDGDYRPVADSGALADAVWTPPRPLPRGIVLAWQVVATRDGRQVTAPAPPAPEARFEVLAPAALADLERAEQAAASLSALGRAVFAARAGLLAEAEAELGTLAAGGGPEAELAGALLRSLPGAGATAQEPSPTSTKGAQ